MKKNVEYFAEELNSSNMRDWNKLNQENVQGSFYHTLKWKEVVDRFSGKTSYFLVYRDGEAVALCPLLIVKWVSKGPFPAGSLRSVANIIVKYPDDPSVAKQIVLKCKEIVRKEELSFTSINLLHDTKDCFRSMGLFPRPASGPSALDSTLDLQEYNPQRVWNSFSRDTRRRVIRPERDGWTVNEITSEQELASFYAYYKANMAYLHANCEKLAYFEFVMETFMRMSLPHEMFVLLLRKNETVAGGLLVFLFDAKKTMYFAHASLNREVSNRYSPLYTLFWHGIRKASEMGYTTVVFGGTPDNPRDIHYRIKEKFCCRFAPRYSVSLARYGIMSPFRDLYLLIHFGLPMRLLRERRYFH